MAYQEGAPQVTQPPVIRHWRRMLLATAWLAAALYGVAATAVVAWLLGWTPWSRAVWPLAGCVGLVVVAWRARRGGVGRLHDERVALWLEERTPAYGYSLLGALEGHAASVMAAQDVTPGPETRRHLVRAVRRALGSAVVGVGLLLVAPARTGRETRATPTSAVAAVARSFRVRVTPPAYTREAPVELDSPDVVRPLVGSRVEVVGGGPAPIVTWDGAAREVRPTPSGWQVVWTATPASGMVTMAWGATARRVLFDPRTDASPVVVLERPSRDTLVREAPRVMPLRATFRDDIALDSTRLEYIVTSGEGERFTFRSGTVRASGVQGRASTTAHDLDLAALALQPGDVVHVRAVATDARGGLGSSETRALRVWRASADDSVAVDAAPPPEVEAGLLSQRMLINLTEALLRRAGSLPAATVRDESVRLGRDQARLRRQVSDLVFARLGDDPSGEHFHGDGHDHGSDAAVRRPLTPEELLQAADRATGARGALLDATHDETPVVAVSRPLLEAYNAMWEAGRALDGGTPRAALPPMYVALAAIQKARAAERLYLRGTPRVVVVDLAKVRLTGRERGAASIREVSSSAPTTGPAAWRRLLKALAQGDASATVDTLLLLRLEAVGDEPLAAAWDSVLAGVRRGTDVTQAVEALRRRLTSGVWTRAPGGWRPVP